MHPKYLIFRQELAALGVHNALEYLVRLWGHCQTMSRGENWGNVDEAYVEAICNWTGEPGKLAVLLLRQFYGRPGWIHRNNDGEIIISSWNEHNSGLLNSWKSGRLGGRPRLTASKPDANPRVNPLGTASKPDANPIGLDVSGYDGNGESAHFPSLQEVIDFGNGAPAIPEDYCRHYHNQKETKRTWLNGRGQLINWRREIVTWWANDRATWDAKKKKRAGENPDTKADLDSILAELQWQKDPKKIADLKKRKKELEAGQ